MKRAALYSAIFHGIIFLFFFIKMPNPFEKTLADQRPLMIEFVNIADLSAAPILAPQSAETPEPEIQEQPEETPVPPEPEPEPEKPLPAPPEPVSEPTPPVEQPPEPEPKLPEPEPTPDTEIIPEEKPKTEPKEIPVEKPKKKPTPPKPKAELTLDQKKPVIKKDDDAKDKKKTDDDFSSLLDEIKKTDKKDSKRSKSAIKGAPADQIGPVLTATDIDAVRRTISRCWLVPNGARGAKNLTVEIDMVVARDGTVTNASIVDKGRYQTDPVFRSAADSAKRAVLDPKCNPLPLPAEKFDEWKNLTMNFNPRDMF